MSKNICFKHKISEQELDVIIHKLLDEVPANTLSLKEAEVVFDLLRYGDIDKNDKLEELETLNFLLSCVLIGCLDCEKCLAKDACPNKNSDDVSLVDCFQNLAFLMQAVEFPEKTSNLKKSTVKDYVEKTLVNDEEFKSLLEKEKRCINENL